MSERLDGKPKKPWGSNFPVISESCVVCHEEVDRYRKRDPIPLCPDCSGLVFLRSMEWELIELTQKVVAKRGQHSSPG